MKNCMRSEKYRLFFWQEVTFAQHLLTTIWHSETPFPNTNSPCFLNLVQRTAFPRKFLNSILIQEPKKGILGKFVNKGKKLSWNSSPQCRTHAIHTVVFTLRERNFQILVQTHESNPFRTHTFTHRLQQVCTMS